MKVSLVWKSLQEKMPFFDRTSPQFAGLSRFKAKREGGWKAAVNEHIPYIGDWVVCSFPANPSWSIRQEKAISLKGWCHCQDGGFGSKGPEVTWQKAWPFWFRCTRFAHVSTCFNIHACRNFLIRKTLMNFQWQDSKGQCFGSIWDCPWLSSLSFDARFFLTQKPTYQVAQNRTLLAGS